MDFGPGSDKEDTSKIGMGPEIATFCICKPGKEFGELSVVKFVSIPIGGDSATILVRDKSDQGWGSGRGNRG